MEVHETPTGSETTAGTGTTDGDETVAVREARTSDVTAVLGVHRASIQGLGPAGYDAEQVAAWRRGRSPDDYAVDADGVYFVVAEADGAVLGFGALREEAGDHLDAPADAEVTAVYVRPSAARQGVGSALLADLEREAREAGAGSLGLWSSLVAVPFYQAAGYDRVADHRTTFADGVEGRVVEMRTVL